MRFLALFLPFIFFACAESKVKVDDHQSARIDSASRLVQSGDLILRMGKDEISQLFARLNTRNQSYSHCGVALHTDSGIIVYHILTSLNQPRGNIIREPLMSFVQSNTNSAWAIVRYDMDSISKNAFCQNIEAYYTRNISFDTHFDLVTDDQMYCSEMIYKALLAATKDTTMVQLSKAQSGKMYIAVDNLFGHKHCKTICQIAYK